MLSRRTSSIESDKEVEIESQQQCTYTRECAKGELYRYARIVSSCSQGLECPDDGGAHLDRGD